MGFLQVFVELVVVELVVAGVVEIAKKMVLKIKKNYVKIV